MPLGLLTIGFAAVGILTLVGYFGPDCLSPPPDEPPPPRLSRPYTSYVLSPELAYERAQQRTRADNPPPPPLPLPPQSSSFSRYVADLRLERERTRPKPKAENPLAHRQEADQQERERLKQLPDHTSTPPIQHFDTDPPERKPLHQNKRERIRDREIEIQRAAELQRQELLRQYEALQQWELLRVERECQIAGASAVPEAHAETPSDSFSDDEITDDDVDQPEPAPYELLINQAVSTPSSYSEAEVVRPLIVEERSEIVLDIQSNVHYQSLRQQAADKGDAMAQSFRESQEAYKAKNGAQARMFSERGKRHKAEMERLNKQASEWIYRELNLDTAPNEIDLHGQFVGEAIFFAEKAVRAAQRRGDSQLRIIVGKGTHSRADPKLKPAIKQHITKLRLKSSLDPRNAGVLVVNLAKCLDGTGRRRRGHAN